MPSHLPPPCRRRRAERERLQYIVRIDRSGRFPALPGRMEAHRAFRDSVSHVVGNREHPVRMDLGVARTFAESIVGVGVLVELDRIFSHGADG